MDTHSKERLTGAVILVTVVVLLVPELLSGPSRSAATPTSNTTDEPPLRSYTIDLAEPPNRPVSASDAPAPVASVPMQGLPAQEEPVPASKEASEPVEESETAAQEPPASADNRSGTAAPPSSPPASSARPEAPATAASTAANTTPFSGWAVQIGSFASRENAERLTSELKSKGFAAFVTRSTQGRRLYRVRVGPEVDRPAAEALAARLRSAGQTGSIVQHP